MGVREAVDRRVVVVVARAGVPVARPRVGTELYHAERRGGAGIGVAVETRADERIDVSDRVGGLRAGGAPAQASSMQVRFRIMVVKVGFVSVFTKVARLPESDGGDLRI